MTTLEQLVQTLGPNKVTIPIHRNDLCEQTVFQGMMQSQSSEFDGFEDLISLFRSRGGNVAKSQPSFQSHKQDPLMEAFACQVDPTLSLFSGADMCKKVNEFRKNLIDNLDNHHQAFKHIPFRMFKLTMEDVKTCLTSPDRTSNLPLLVYMSNLLKSNIVMGRDTIHYDTDRYIIIHKTPFDKYEFDLHEQGFSQLRCQQAKQVEPKKLNTMLVSELRALASQLNIPIVKTTDEGKKKQLLKADLISEITRHLATLK